MWKPKRRRSTVKQGLQHSPRWSLWPLRRLLCSSLVCSHTWAMPKAVTAAPLTSCNLSSIISKLQYVSVLMLLVGRQESHLAYNKSYCSNSRKMTFGRPDLIRSNSKNVRLDKQLESLIRHETSSTVCLRMHSKNFSICCSTVTLNFDLLIPKFNSFMSVL